MDGQMGWDQTEQNRTGQDGMMDGWKDEGRKGEKKRRLLIND